MHDTTQSPPVLPLGEDESLPALVTRLAGEVRVLANAEITVYKAKLGDTIGRYRTAAIFFAAAGVLALAGLIALLLGLILTLTPSVGAGGATAIVVVAVIVLAVILGMFGTSKLKSRAA